MNCNAIFGGSLHRSIRTALSAKTTATALVFCLVGLSFQVNAGLPTERTLDSIVARPSPYEEPHVWRFDEDQNDEWMVRDSDIHSGSYEQEVPVAQPDPEVLCPALDERWADLGCDDHPHNGPNGCGGAGAGAWIWGMLIPQQIPDTPLSAVDSCNAHDRCYGRVGADKADCDAQFGADIHATCTNGSDSIYQLCNATNEGSAAVAQCVSLTTDRCHGAALMYQGAVTSYGHNFFAKGQVAGVCLQIKTQKNALDCP
jgi:hypothetical protein